MARKRKAVESVESTVTPTRATADEQPAAGTAAVAEPIVSTVSEIADVSDPVSRPDSRERIASRAYEIYLERGGNHGQDLEDWLEAERQTSERAERPADD